MRLLLIGFAMTCAGLAVCCSSADAAKANRHRYTYGSCYCDFGYADRPCKPVVSCYDEGGRCKKSCPRQL